MKRLLMLLCAMAIFCLPAAAEPIKKTFHVGNYKFVVTCTEPDQYGNLDVRLMAYYGRKFIGKVEKIREYGSYANCFYTIMPPSKDAMVFIVLTLKGSGSYGRLLAFGASPGKIYSLEPFETVKIDPRAKLGYMGHDRFYLEGAFLVDEFPLYNEKDPNCCPSGGKMLVKYNLLKRDKKSGYEFVYAGYENRVTVEKKKKPK